MFKVELFEKIGIGFSNILVFCINFKVPKSTNNSTCLKVWRKSKLSVVIIIKMMRAKMTT